MKILEALIFFTILILTKEFEVTDQQANFHPEVGGRLPGLPVLQGLERLDNCSEAWLETKPISLQDGSGNSAFSIASKKNCLFFWRHFKKQQKDEEFSYGEKLMVLTHIKDSGHEIFREDHGNYPYRYVTVSEDISHHPDPVSSSRTLQTPNDPILEFDHQQILMLEDDEVVRTAAASLYEKYPTVSSVQVVDPQQRFQQVKGQPVALTELSSLVLVGHGARDGSGEMRVSGYSYKDVARIVLSASRIGQKIQTTTLVACDAGSDRRFREALLEKLHQAGMDTELHLWNTLVQVSEAGDVLSQDDSADGPQWRSEDQTKKAVLSVGRNGEISRRKEDGRRGRIVDTPVGIFLGKGDKKVKGAEKLPSNENLWPDKPMRFIDPDIYRHIDQNNVTELQEAFWELESLTWGLFYSELNPEPLKVDFDPNQNEMYILRNKELPRDKTSPWINDPKELKEKLAACYIMKSGKDIRNIIRHYAKDRESETTYLMVNDWIFEVEPKKLYILPAGKFFSEIQQEQITLIKKFIDLRDKNLESYSKIKYNIFKIKNGNKDYVYYVTQIFKGNLVRKDPKQEMFFIWYFIASVISESARNFRTFPLTLMALNKMDKTFLFDDHSMADGGHWIDSERRGFGGAAAGHGLKDVLIKEYEMFKKYNDEPDKEMAQLAIDYGIFTNEEQFRNDYNNFRENTKP